LRVWECTPLRGRLSTKELVEGCKVKPVFDLEELTGIRSTSPRGFADNEYALDLAREAANPGGFEISKYQAEGYRLGHLHQISSPLQRPELEGQF